MTMHQYPPNQADAIVLVTIPTAYAPVTIFKDAILEWKPDEIYHQIFLDLSIPAASRRPEKITTLAALVESGLGHRQKVPRR